MPDPIITNNSNYGVVVFGAIYQDENIFDAAALTYEPGTILDASPLAET